MHERSLLEWVASVSRSLRGARVGHALAGGLAVAVWARPRATVDMGLVVPTDEESITRAREALAAEGLIQTRRKAVQFKRMGLLRMAIPPADGRYLRRWAEKLRVLSRLRAVGLR